MNGYLQTGLCSAVQSFLGEVPFFLLSDWIVKTIGYNNALTVSLASISLRYLGKYLLRCTFYIFFNQLCSLFTAYGYAIQSQASAYYILIIELFQGPAYGLFYVVMTAIAQDFSMKCIENDSTNHQVQSNGTNDQYSTHEIRNLDKIVPSNRHSPQNWSSSLNLGTHAIDNDAVSQEQVDINSATDDKNATSFNVEATARENESSLSHLDGATVECKVVSSQVDVNCDAHNIRSSDCDVTDKTYATMQGFFSGLFEGAGLGLGALVAGLLIDKMGSIIAWRFAGYFSLFVCIGNFLVNLNLEKCSN